MQVGSKRTDIFQSLPVARDIFAPDVERMRVEGYESPFEKTGPDRTIRSTEQRLDRSRTGMQAVEVTRVKQIDAF